jgi:hypothetical protein
MGAGGYLLGAVRGGGFNWDDGPTELAEVLGKSALKGFASGAASS